VVTQYIRPTERVLFSPRRDANPVFHLMEALWMLAGESEVAWLSQFSSNIASYAEHLLGKELFAQARIDVVPSATDAQINSYDADYDDDDETLARYMREKSYSSASPHVTTVGGRIRMGLMRKYPNADDIDRVVKTWETAYIADILQREREEEEIKKREEENKAREMEATGAAEGGIPTAFVKRMAAIGIACYVNTKDCSHVPRVRDGGAPNSRIFLFDDTGKNGPIYRIKDTYLKPELDADFTKGWREKSGACWHIAIKRIVEGDGWAELADRLERAKR
jgi:hypothetical protein